MQRRIVEPADVSEALTELKSWLGITRPNEDALLTDLLQTALSMCESFTGQTPLSQLIEERIPIQIGQSILTSQPVNSVSGVELIAQNGDRAALATSQFATEIRTRGDLKFQLLEGLEGQALVVTLRVGIGETWDTVPASLKQGIIRLCAYYYRDRDRPGDGKKMSSPPAIVSALWRPWQTPRLS